MRIPHRAVCASPSTQSLPNLATYKGIAIAMWIVLDSIHYPIGLELQCPPLPPPASLGTAITRDHSVRRLDSVPTHLELMNRVAVYIPTKWRDVGLQLGLSTTDLEVIEARHGHAGDYHTCFSCVFSVWERQLNSAYTWSTITQALDTALVGEQRLAEEIRSALAVAQYTR